MRWDPDNICLWGTRLLEDAVSVLQDLRRVRNDLEKGRKGDPPKPKKGKGYIDMEPMEYLPATT